MTQIIFATLNGMALGSTIFLVAAGVTLIYGILHILNFAHGGFFMIGAYVAFSILTWFGSSSLPFYLAAAIAAGAVVALLGYVVDRTVLRRLQAVDDYYSLIATFALLLCCDGAVKLIWGVDYYSVFPPAVLAGAIRFGGVVLPSFSLFIVGTGILIFVALEIGIHRLWIGKIIQGLRYDRWMSSLVGVNVQAMFTGTVAVAFMLAGFAGGLMLANQSLSPQLGHAYLIQSFVAVIIGGFGNIRGAFIASLILGLSESLGTLVLPTMPGFVTYCAIAVFLIYRPNGLLARKQT